MPGAIRRAVVGGSAAAAPINLAWQALASPAAAVMRSTLPGSSRSTWTRMVLYIVAAPRPSGVELAQPTVALDDHAACARQLDGPLTLELGHRAGNRLNGQSEVVGDVLP